LEVSEMRIAVRLALLILLTGAAHVARAGETATGVAVMDYFGYANCICLENG
jgi:hypothetical protein